MLKRLAAVAAVAALCLTGRFEAYAYKEYLMVERQIIQSANYADYVHELHYCSNGQEFDQMSNAVIKVDNKDPFLDAAVQKVNTPYVEVRRELDPYTPLADTWVQYKMYTQNALENAASYVTSGWTLDTSRKYLLDFDYKLDGPYGDAAVMRVLFTGGLSAADLRGGNVDLRNDGNTGWKHARVFSASNNGTTGIGIGNSILQLRMFNDVSPEAVQNAGAELRYSFANFIMREVEPAYGGDTVVYDDERTSTPYKYKTGVNMLKPDVNKFGWGTNNWTTPIPLSAMNVASTGIKSGYTSDGRVKLTWKAPIIPWETGNTTFYLQFNIYENLNGKPGKLIKAVNTKTGDPKTGVISTGAAEGGGAFLYGSYILPDETGYTGFKPYNFLINISDIHGTETALNRNVSPSGKVRALENFEADDPSAGAAGSSVKVTNLLDTSYDFVMITALYADNRLINVNCEPKSIGITPVGGTVVRCNIEVPPESIADGGVTYRLRSFIWNNMGDINPVMTAGPGHRMPTELKGNIFLSDKEKKLKLNTGVSPVAVTVKDYWGQKAADLTGDTGGSKEILLPDGLEPGYYTVDVSDGNGNYLYQTSMAIITTFDFMKYSYEDSDFGVCTHLEWEPQGWDYSLLDEIEQMGARSIRDGNAWNNMEQIPGQYSLKAHVSLPSMLETRKMGLLHASGYINGYYDGNRKPHTGEGQLGFANYVSNFAQQFGPSYMGVDVYNEFWGTIGGDNSEYSGAEYYIPLQKKVYEVVKADVASGKIGHDVKVLSNHIENEVVASWNPNWYELTVSDPENNVKDAMDALFTHPYFNAMPPETKIPQVFDGANGLTAINARNGVNTGLWVTETGASIDEKTQAKYVPRAYALFKERGVNKIFWYDFMNDGITNTGEDRFGFVRNKADPLGAYSPKPSYVAYAVMARMLTGTKYVGGGYPDGAHSKNSLYWYEFRGENNESIHIVWRDGAPASKTVTVQTAEAQLEVTDIMGRVRNYTPSGGQITLTVSDEVMYIKGNIIDITQ